MKKKWWVHSSTFKSTFFESKRRIKCYNLLSRTESITIKCDQSRQTLSHLVFKLELNWMSSQRPRGSKALRLVLSHTVRSNIYKSVLLQCEVFLNVPTMRMKRMKTPVHTCGNSQHSPTATDKFPGLRNIKGILITGLFFNKPGNQNIKCIPFKLNCNLMYVVSFLWHLGCVRTSTLTCYWVW